MVVSKSKPGKSTNDGKLVETVFEEFAQALDPVAILVGFHKLKAAVGAENLENSKELYAILKSKLQSWKCKSLWEVLDARAKHKEYGNGTICEELQVLVIGAGPIGLRTAIEVALLGAKVTIVEKRTTFGRNNVLHLWPFLIHDFRSLGAKRFYGKFCAGSLDHISIKILQCTLMKTALILGVQIYTGVTFEKLVEPTGDNGWRCFVNPPFHPASQLDFDMVVGADGKKNVLPDFPQIEMRGSLAIGITLNLVYHGTKEEAAIPEVSGLAYHFKPQFFDDLYQQSGVRLENFVYYKNETHYFVMTAVKSSLLAKGALIMDYSKPVDLLAPQNVNQEKLMEYALDAVKFGTNGKLTNMEFVINDRGKPDIAVFDFTSLKKAEHAARIVERKGHRLLMTLVGDSLIEPFWPTGSGCARGVLSALDTAWMLRSFALDKPPLQVLSERENIYKVLSATTVGNMRKKYNEYTINPFTRYVDLNLKRVKEVYHLYDCDDPVNADFRVGSPTGVSSLLENTKRRLSVSNLHGKVIKNRRKSSSDDLDEKKDTKAGRKKSKYVLRHSASRDLDDALNETTGGKTKATKAKKAMKKMRSRQSSESADEKDVRARRLRKLGRTKSRETDGSNNSLDTITESPKNVVKAKNKDENKENSKIMKQRSTTRWRLFSGTRQKQYTVNKEETPRKDHGKEKQPKKEIEQKNAAGNKPEIPKSEEVERNRMGFENEKVEKKGDQKQPEKVTQNAQLNAKSETQRGSIKETAARSTLRQLSKQENSSPRPLRDSLRKPSELRTSKEESLVPGYSRSTSYKTAVSARSTSETTTPQTIRANGEMKRRERLIGSLRRPKQEKGEEEKPNVIPTEAPQSEAKVKPEQQSARRDNKHAKQEEGKSKGSVSVFDDIKSLSPAAQRTAPLLAKLTPEKKNGKPGEGGVVSALAGIAAVVALTTPLAMEEQEPLTEFQIKRRTILSSSKGKVKEKIDLLNKAGSSGKLRRDLSADLDNVDGTPKPVKRFFSFSTAQRNVKQKLEQDSSKYATLPRKFNGRHSVQSTMGSTYTDIPSALDSALDILIKQYKFKALQNTLKMMLNMFRCISKDPEAEIPRRVCTDGDMFRSLVWNIKEAKLFMIVSGWIEIGSFILFPKSKTVHEPIRVLMQNYRVLSEQQDLNTSCPEPIPTEYGQKNRRLSDDVFRTAEQPQSSSSTQYASGNPRDLAKDDGKDTGSHSSDSGMGFSETASENNVPAVLAIKNTQDADDEVAFGAIGNCVGNVKSNSGAKTTVPEINRAKRLKVEDGKAVSSASGATTAMNPKKYLDDSNVGESQRPNLDPKLYVKNDSSLLLSVEEEQVAKKKASPGGVEHNGETLEKNYPTSPLSEGIHHAPSLQEEKTREDDKRREVLAHNVRGSSLREARKLSNTLDALIGSMDDPMEDIDQSTQSNTNATVDHDTLNEVPPDQERRTSNKENVKSKDSNIGVLTSESGRDSRGSAKEHNKSNKLNELDDLFDTLDFVSEVLEPPRIVYDEKPTSEPKRSRKPAKTTETSRRRERLTRSKLRDGTMEERSSPRPKHKTRNRGVRHRHGNDVNNADYDAGQITRIKGARRTEKSSAIKKQDTVNDIDKKNRGIKFQDEDDADAVKTYSARSGSDESPPRLRRSRRIAESSRNGRNAVLTLEESACVEESTTDLNQAFVDSKSEESLDEYSKIDNMKQESQKPSSRPRKVRRRSSVVKTNKSRAHTRRAYFRVKKDRSTDG